MPHEIPIIIPKVFHCEQTGSLFDRCLVCGNLLTSWTTYLIEKARRGGETLYEYAVCLACYASLREDLSAASTAAVDRFFDERVDFQLRNIELKAIARGRVEPWLSECVVYRTPIEPQGEYQMFALCRGSSLIMDRFPYAICGEAVEELLELLSPKTRGEMDRFIEEHLGLPPEVVRGPADRVVLL
jgi:hypothetical protein